jgi:23S rRNA pseudouridine955/2504/2580 synthase
MLEFRIDSDHAGVRLDKVLRQRLPRVPASHLQKMIRTKKVRVNGRRAQPEQPLAEGDLLTVRGDERALLGQTPVPPRAPDPSEVARLRVLYEDGWLMAVDKPSGLAVHTGSGITGGTLVDLVRAYLGAQAERNGFSASPAHRLDRETSGVILVAKRRPAMVHFTEVFTHGGARKQYLALAKGSFPRSEGRIDLPLSEHQQTATSKARRGVNMQEAGTRWRVVRPGGQATLLEVALETGRTHQIRRHLAAIGHPVAGDRKYGDFAFNREARVRWGLKRLFLHAERLEVPHPETGARLRVEAPLPPELEDALRRAGMGAGEVESGRRSRKVPSAGA